MKLVADANILFSLAKKGSSAERIAARFGIKLYSPDYVLSELAEHKKEIEEKTGSSYSEALSRMKKYVIFIEEKEYRHHLKEAEDGLPDKEDAPYYALAMKLSVPIWSNDKHLKKQDKAITLTTKELIDLLAP